MPKQTPRYLILIEWASRPKEQLLIVATVHAQSESISVLKPLPEGWSVFTTSSERKQGVFCLQPRALKDTLPVWVVYRCTVIPTTSTSSNE